MCVEEQGGQDETEEATGVADKGLERDAYLEERKLLIEAEGESSQSFDKFLITLSSGAFGLSLAFIVQVAPKPEALWFIYVAWIGLLLALTSVLSSFLMAQYGFRRAQRILDTFQESGKQEGNRWNALITFLNIVSIISFVIGVTSLACFAIKNLT